MREAKREIYQDKECDIKIQNSVVFYWPSKNGGRSCQIVRTAGRQALDTHYLLQFSPPLLHFVYQGSDFSHLVIWLQRLREVIYFAQGLAAKWQKPA